MSVEIRNTKPEERRLASDTMSDALLFPRSTDEDWEQRSGTWDGTQSLSAWEGERCVGHVGAFPLYTTVPGGAQLSTSGVTRIGVLPTHTRRGLLTTMIRQLLTEARTGGAVLASLRASEAVIYQRFGFEIAGEAVTATVSSRSVGSVRAPAAGTMRILQPAELLDVVPPLYERVGRSRVGFVSRPPYFWKRILQDAIEMKKPSFVAVHEDLEGSIDGYVHYDVRWDESPLGDETGAGIVHDVFARDASVERALWAYVFGIDLVLEWRLGTRPVEDPLRFAISDPRVYRIVERWDEQWLRMLDVNAALTARSYGASRAEVTIQVADPLFADNEGTWRIGPDAVTRCEFGAGAADLMVTIGTLSAAYLGGTSWRQLADSGRVEVRNHSAIATADALFAERPTPFCGTFF